MATSINNSNQNGPLSEDQLADFETTLGARLPEDYRAFLLIHNGGSPNPKDFQTSANNTSSVRNFWGLHNGRQDSSLQWNMENYKDELPAGLMSIGKDDFGNQICISIAGTAKGAIVFWDHEIGAISPLADSFSLFLDGLKASAYKIQRTDVEEACASGDTFRVKEYVAAGGNINHQNEHRQSLMMIAAIHGRTEVVQYLASQNANITGVLAFAAKNGRVDIVRYLLDHRANADEDTPILHAAAYGYLEVVKVLIEHGADVNASDDRGRTALQLAQRGDHHEVVKLLQQAATRD